MKNNKGLLHLDKSKKQLEYYLAVLITTIILLQLGYSFYHIWPYTTDDAFISWRYAKSLAEGQGLLWNPASTPVEGYSNFSWVILAFFFLKLGLPFLPAIKCFAILCLLAALIFLYRFSRTFLSPLLAILPVYLFSHYNGVAWWTVSGLETSLFIALILLINWQVSFAVGFRPWSTTTIFNRKNYDAKAWMISCIGLTLLALTRFEGVLWAFILFPFIWCCHFHQNFTNQQIRSILSTFLICFILPYSIYLGWRLIYFGHFLPNSYACKISMSQYAFYLVHDYFYLAFPCLIFGFPYLLARKDCRHLLLWLPSLVYCLLLWHANPINAYYNRLFLGAFSVLTLLPALGLREFLNYFHLSSKNNVLISTLIFLLFTTIFIPGNQITVIDTAVKNYQQRSLMRKQVALFLNRHVANKGSVLLADCGIVPFFARKDIQFIDSLCLNNPEMTSAKFNHSEFSYANYLKEIIKPDWVIRSFYPHWQQNENDLTLFLQKLNFFKDYQLVTTYQSHRFSLQQGKFTKNEVDFVYKIYVRHGLVW